MSTKSPKPEFFQDGPELENQFKSDALLTKKMAQVIPADVWNQIKPHLQEVGEDAVGKLWNWSLRAEEIEPKLVQSVSQSAAQGKKVDQIIMPEEWKNIQAYASEHGIVASGYERKQGEWSRVYQMALLYLFHPSSAFVSCPLAMTDGAAKLIEVYGDQSLKEKAFRHLTSRDPKQFWTSGQWMTEKIGGSDVGLTETTATINPNSQEFNYQLHGIKYFTSATTSPMAMTLARPEGAETGSRGLSLFYLETGAEHGSLNHIEVLRLKDKLGTRAMPTAELQLHGTPAKLVGGLGQGVKKISTLFNVTRIYNSICSIGQMRRALALAENYSRKRFAFGKNVSDHGLFQNVFSDLVAEFEGCFELVMHVSHLLGKEEVGLASSEEMATLRALTPIVKLYTGKSAVSIVSEVVECFGGVGYCEDTGIPKLLRDAQVFPIWEGTTNVLSLDFLRALSKDCPPSILMDHFTKVIQQSPSSAEALKLRELVDVLQKFPLQSSEKMMPVLAREFSLFFSRVYIASLLIQRAQKFNDPRDLMLAKRWMARIQKPLILNESDSIQNNFLYLL